MTKYSGLSAFEDDSGTLWVDESSAGISITELQKTHGSWRRHLKRRLRRRPLIWFVDDERANREWFRKWHSSTFSIVTFSTAAAVRHALQMDLPCDAVITDIFFPARPPSSDADAEDLLGVHEEIRMSKVSELPDLWQKIRKSWTLDGFRVALDVADHARQKRERIPVLLFSRKATLMLHREDWLAGPALAVENTIWMFEKIDPSSDPDGARIAATVQRLRITAALRFRQAATPPWRRLLGGISIGFGPLRFSLAALSRD